MVMWLSGSEHLFLALPRTTLGGFSHCGSEDKMFLTYHVILKDYVLHNFMGKNP